MDKSAVLSKVKEYIRTKEKGEPDKKAKKLISVLERITNEAISFGKEPEYFIAYISCNSTGVGRSSFQGTESQRTVARDYVTDECLFIDGHVGAGAKGLQFFFLKRGQSIRYYSKNEIVKLAKETGYQLHLQYFSDLNYYLHDHRLNRYSVNVTEGPFTYPIRPIIASVSEDGDKFTLGYIYEKDGQERILIEPDEEAALTDESRKGCSGWKLLGFLFPPILLIQFLVKFFKAEQERMRG